MAVDDADGDIEGERRRPDISADVHLAALQSRVRCQVNGVGGLAAVVLVDEHRVFCDVEAGGVPGR